MPSAFDDEWGEANSQLNNAFGEQVVLVELGRTITATVDIPTREQKIGAIATELPDPSITAQDGELAGLLEKHQVNINGELYRVVRTLPDGTGWTKAVLEPAQIGFTNDFN